MFGYKNIHSFFNRIQSPLSQSIDYVGKIMNEKLTMCPNHLVIDGFIVLIHHLIENDEQFSDAERLEINKRLKLIIPLDQFEKIELILQNKTPLIMQKNVQQALIELSIQDRLMLLESLVFIAYSSKNRIKSAHQTLQNCAKELNLSEQTLELLIEKESQQYEKTKNLAVSISGILSAIAIILVFIIAAIFLNSVFFGFVLSLLFLPVQQFFYHRLFNTTPYRKFYSILNCLFLKKSQVDNELNLQKKLTLQSTVCTCLFALFFGLVFLFCISTYSFLHIQNVGVNVKAWADKTIQETTVNSITNNPQKEDIKITSSNKSPSIENTNSINSLSEIDKLDNDSDKLLKNDKNGQEAKSQYIQNLIAKLVHKLESYRPLITTTPGINIIVQYTEEYLRNPENQSKLISTCLNYIKESFAPVAGAVSSSIQFVFNLLLSLFFFVLFLQKFAIFTTITQFEKKTNTPGQFITHTIFSSPWFPQLNQDAQIEASTIIDTVINKIKSWVRGFFTIILIEVPLYITVFYLLGVPHPIILGALSGCTVLLPIIGPTVVISLTLLISIAMGDQMPVSHLILILVTYGFIIGILESLILYPKLVGEALGLTLIETIIVVLLGGYFFGLIGMLLAVPTASVIKYLIPQIYKIWVPFKSAETSISKN